MRFIQVSCLGASPSSPSRMLRAKAAAEEAILREIPEVICFFGFYLSIYLSICFGAYLPFYLSIYLSIYLYMSTHENGSELDGE